MKTLEQVRIERGVTKAAIVKHLGISRPTYDIYEKHPDRMRIETAKELAEFLRIDLEEIFFIGDGN